jgi:hypothetical protein
VRSHGFFYKPDGETSGTLGLPISTAGRPGYKHLTEDSAAILFLRSEIVEGKLDQGRMQELRRVNYFSRGSARIKTRIGILIIPC